MRIKKIALLGVVAAFTGLLSSKFSLPHLLEFDAHERGRYADSPYKMTWLGWKDILTRSWFETWDDRLLSVAAGVAFFAILALAPALTVLVSLFGLVADASKIDAQLAPMMTFLPEAAVQLIQDQAHRIAGQPNKTLSFNLVLGLVVALWSANAGMKAMFDALNVIYEETEKRSFIKLNAVSLFVTVSAVFLLIFAMLLIAVLPAVIAWSPFSAQVDWTITLLRWPVFFAVATLAIAALYWIGPSRNRVQFRWVLPGALCAALLWATVSAGFGYYVSTLGNYQATYGSLSTVIVFLTWLWLSACVILMGAEVNSELEHQTARDTTTGLPKPLGMRGATMADRVGPRAS